MRPNESTCSCGETKPHVIARREAADGVHVLLWDNGAVTGALGYKLPGVVMRNPRTPRSIELARRAGWLLLGEVCLWSVDELPRLQRACESIARKGGLPGEVRARMRDESPSLRPVWETISSDRDGRTTERVWRLPRMLLPGVAVFHRRHGRYAVYYEIGRSGTYRTSGLEFDRKRDVVSFLTREAGGQ